MAGETYDVPPGEPVYECPDCGRPFSERRLLALHRGLDHPDRLDEAQREAFESAYEAEAEPLRRYRIAAVGVLVVLYFGLLMAFALLG
ncbi:C2H2-type zinc finger protein [Halapricum desulfuricans]|uniref:Metal-binding domain n=1 Tax=Halapricum desulfuricans TaxID=2841257 RepID=A0A897N3L7_9EURY|nr:C2H2-type zinc finger protein [Halapricum desulfuricans]QSG05365.1 Metal-binding domain [Halapricum desulfuricans]